GNLEYCLDNVDNNCNSAVDEEGAVGCTVYYRDDDNDSFGLQGDSRCLCAPLYPYTATVDGDCNDDSVTTSPNASEVCDGADNDCDASVDEEDADGCVFRYEDKDNDGYGLTESVRCLCANDGYWAATEGGECNDTDPSIHPNGVEICDGVDSDCDNQTDEPGSLECVFYYRDEDTDGWGVAGDQQCVCGASPPYTATKSGDCQDDNQNVHPGILEVCDGIDNDCSDGTDEVDAVGCTAHYRDEDEDGYGVTADSLCLCEALAPYSATEPGDCFDGNPEARPDQNAFFAVERGDGSFDWDCDLNEEFEYPNTHATICSADGEAGCGDGFCCITALGWEGLAPACGDIGQWISACEGQIVSDVFSCKNSGEAKTQFCR
ncbi:MAG: putative metal-binding motif-containing protein, partial [Myxococcota bacterium]|nr:putative metal-binding motif-containing protein [Myxococcota bacterium]